MSKQIISFIDKAPTSYVAATFVVEFPDGTDTSVPQSIYLIELNKIASSNTKTGNFWTFDLTIEGVADNESFTYRVDAIIDITPTVSKPLIAGVATGLEPTEQPTVIVRDTPTAKVLDLGIPKGVKGDAGKSAYDLAVLKGYAGTLEQ